MTSSRLPIVAVVKNREKDIHGILKYCLYLDDLPHTVTQALLYTTPSLLVDCIFVRYSKIPSGNSQIVVAMTHRFFAGMIMARLYFEEPCLLIGSLSCIVVFLAGIT